MSKQTKKRQHSELSTTAEPTPPLLPESVNRTEARGQHSTQSAKMEHTKTSMTSLSRKLSSPISSVNDNAKMAANILTATLPALIEAGMVTKATHRETGNILLVFNPSMWTDDFRLRE